MDDSLLVTSLGKDWEDIDSEERDVNVTDVLKSSPKPPETDDDGLAIKNEVFEIVDSATDQSPEQFKNEKDAGASVNDETTPELTDFIDKTEFTDEEQLSARIDLPAFPMQRFLVQINADEITLTPDPVQEITSTKDDFENQERQETIADTPNIYSPSIENINIPDDEDTHEALSPFNTNGEQLVMPDISAPDCDEPQITFRKKRSVVPVCNPQRVASQKSPEKISKQQRLEAANGSNSIPSVYSYWQIQRHKKRLSLKALEDNSDSDSDSNSSEDSYNPDLDINLRIFEETGNTSKDNVIIGEIHCDARRSDEASNEKQNKNTSVFKLSVKSGSSENCQINHTVVNNESAEVNPESTEDSNKMNDDKIDEDEDMNGLCSLYDDDFFSDDDSDLEILAAKSIIRKRPAIPMLRKEKPADSEKRTMFDLICDSMQSMPKQKEKSKTAPKKRVPRKTKTDTPKKKGKKKSSNTENTAEVEAAPKRQKITESEETNEKCDEDGDIVTTDDALPVPQLKITADGQVVIDTDSLTIEQTGVAEAREAIANSEIIEETGHDFKSYSRKPNLKKQWSPHETLKFYDVLSVVGTDFTLMATLFPGRTRNCIKRKYKREEKTNRDLILKALTCKQKFNISLLEKELKLKEDKVNLMKINAKKEKAEKKKEEKSLQKKADPKPQKKVPNKRKSFFERGISCFQET